VLGALEQARKLGQRRADRPARQQDIQQVRNKLINEVDLYISFSSMTYAHVYKHETKSRRESKTLILLIFHTVVVPSLAQS
jgi:hypothetical protein